MVGVGVLAVPVSARLRRLDGHGVETSPEGVRYEGEWLDGKYHGHGVYTFMGTRYEGGWSAGERHGLGVETRSDGTRIEGVWMDGVFLPVA